MADSHKTEDELPRRLCELVRMRTGLQVRDRGGEKLRTAVATRCVELGLDPASYHDLLRDQTTASQQEWRLLISTLTTGETFFLRDKGQMQLLENKVLPELIESRQDTRALKIWSAGCSTGEEVYSLAMLLDQLLKTAGPWSVQILGSDIDEAALQRARKGVYTSWSFRQVNSFWQQKYFRQKDGGWEVVPQLRERVTFTTGNLVGDSFPSGAWRDFDLVLCRNVFIYFDAHVTAAVAEKLARSLKPGGYLVTGHGELRGVIPPELESLSFDESVVYRRLPSVLRSVEVSPLTSAASNTKAESERVPMPVDTATSRCRPPDRGSQEAASQEDGAENLAIELEIQRLLQDGSHRAAATQAVRAAERFPQNSRLRYLLAQAHANLGEHDQAHEECQRALEADPFNADLVYLLAHIAEEEQRVEDAKAYFKQVLYLVPSHVEAHWGLAALYDRQGDRDRADKLRSTARSLLSSATGPSGEGTNPAANRAELYEARGTT